VKIKICTLLFILVGCKSRNYNSEQNSLWKKQETRELDDIKVLGNLGSAELNTSVMEQAKLKGCTEEANTLVGNLTDNTTKMGVVVNPFQKKPKVNETYLVVNSVQAPFCLKPKNNAAGFPEEFQGVWWMNGNPMPDVLVSFGNAEWNNDTQNVSLPIYAPLNWSWTGSPYILEGQGSEKPNYFPRGAGLFLHRAVSILGVRYNFNASEYQTSGSTQIFPSFLNKLQGTLAKLATFKFQVTQTKTSADEETKNIIERDSSMLGRALNDYSFTRIIDKNGQPIPENFFSYLESMKNKRMAYQLIYKGLNNFEK
jgi:hypothetical protein